MFLSGNREMPFYNVTFFAVVVVINNSELLAGYMEKGNLGSGSKTNIFYVILRDFGEQHAADSLLRLSRLISAFISEFFL